MNCGELSNFCVLKAFSDKGESILNCLMPFVEYGIVKAGTEYIETDQLKTTIFEYCYIDIPGNTLKTLLKRLKKDNILTGYENWKIIQLTDKKQINIDEYNEKIQISNRDVTSFMNNCIKFTKLDQTVEEMSLLLYSFIQVYQQYIDVNNENFELHASDYSEEFLKISEFISYISEYDNNDFLAFKNIFYGYILRQFVSSNDINNQNKIHNLTIYIDTNFILRILNMQALCFTQGSNELLGLMQKHDMKIIALPEVIAEARRVLHANLQRFIYDKDNMIALHNGQVKELDGIIGAFFRSEKSFSELAEQIDNIEKDLVDKGLIVQKEEIPQTIVGREKEFQKIFEFKLNSKNVKNIINDEEKKREETLTKNKALLDSRILQYIRSKRREIKYQFEKCEYLFLTCDNTIYNVNSFYHNPEGSVPESINENNFTNILFINNPSLTTDAPIKLLISIFNSSKYLNYNILNKFHKDLEKYINQHPDKQKFLGYVFRNQNLFTTIALEYDDEFDDDGTSEFLYEIFKQAENESQELEQINEQDKMEMQNQINELAKKLEEITSEHNELKSSIEKSNEDVPRKNIIDEAITKKSIHIIACSAIIVAFICSAVFIDFPHASLSKDWFFNLTIWISILAILINIAVKTCESDTIQRIVNCIVYKDNSDSLFQIFIIIFFKSLLWLLVMLIVPIIWPIMVNFIR